MKRASLVLAVLAVLGACGDNHKVTPDGGGSGTPDGGSPAATLTAYVLDLIANHTTATDAARPYTEFQSLPDPDGDSNNGSAYSSLF